MGLVWALFHLPYFFTLGSSQTDMPPLSFTLRVIGLSVLFTWLYNNTRGSVLLAYLLHAAVNTWSRVFPIDHAPPLADWLSTGVTCLAAAAVLAAFGAEHLTRNGRRVRHPAAARETSQHGAASEARATLARR